MDHSPCFKSFQWHPITFSIKEQHQVLQSPAVPGVCCSVSPHLIPFPISYSPIQTHGLCFSFLICYVFIPQQVPIENSRKALISVKCQWSGWSTTELGLIWVLSPHYPAHHPHALHIKPSSLKTYFLFFFFSIINLLTPMLTGGTSSLTATTAPPHGITYPDDLTFYQVNMYCWLNLS